MKTASPVRPLRKTAAAAVAAALLCALVAGAPASAHHTYDTDAVPPQSSWVNYGPTYGWRNHIVNSNPVHYSGSHWSWEGSVCGRWGCRENYLTTTSKGQSVWWYMGDVQGAFRVYRSFVETVSPEKMGGRRADDVEGVGEALQTRFHMESGGGCKRKARWADGTGVGRGCHTESLSWTERYTYKRSTGRRGNASPSKTSDSSAMMY